MRKGEKLPDELRNQFTKKTMPDAMPREQLRRAPNPRLVSDEDLIAILLRTGSHGCNVKELARRRDACPYPCEDARERVPPDRQLILRATCGREDEMGYLHSALY